MSYAWEQLHLAVRSMAMSEDDINTRLERALVYRISAISPHPIPKDIEEDLSGIMEKVTAEIHHEGEGLIAANVKQMSKEDALEIIDTIVSMYNRVCRQEG